MPFQGFSWLHIDSNKRNSKYHFVSTGDVQEMMTQAVLSSEPRLIASAALLLAATENFAVKYVRCVRSSAAAVDVRCSKASAFGLGHLLPSGVVACHVY